MVSILMPNEPNTRFLLWELFLVSKLMPNEPNTTFLVWELCFFRYQNWCQMNPIRDFWYGSCVFFGTKIDAKWTQYKIPGVQMAAPRALLLLLAKTPCHILRCQCHLYASVSLGLCLSYPGVSLHLGSTTHAQGFQIALKVNDRREHAC